MKMLGMDRAIVTGHLSVLVFADKDIRIELLSPGFEHVVLEILCRLLALCSGDAQSHQRPVKGGRLITFCLSDLTILPCSSFKQFLRMGHFDRLFSPDRD